ncbi:MAG: CoA pyrophosphatase [Saprospiraceae bacterium]|nr:CoA pyrophosphatase [Saprospiraceae bacterium]MBK8483032.1 CoA pyrophosphatase [Saprospiraceae bacterium]MBK9220562.1 CoA pyrophosphatase [Saprospiraceae bacterium]MBK9722589.1 CoA pyrophosphatase [Saprospiraceae bacterium]MBK9729609.1 CoA pyrophosphatase [Saprospiraceae bacterium]
MLNIDQIKFQLKEPLPGKAAHLRLAPFAARLNYAIPDDVHIAAVLILIYERNQEYYFPLITRQSNHPADKHKGQIALPGGRKDPADIDTQATALRECVEEIGISEDQVEILGALSPIYIPVSYHHVYPYVAYYHGKPEFNLQQTEIYALHEIQLSELQIPDYRKNIELITTEGPLREVPAIQIGDLVIWGATGMILEEFSELVNRL